MTTAPPTTPATPASRPAREGTNMGDAINRALAQALEEDDRTLVMGEDVGRLGGVFRITRGLRDRFGAGRVVDTPLSEAGIVGTAIGMALNGLRPIVEIQFDGFLYPALNQICCHMAKYPARVGEPGALPMVLRLPVGGRIHGSEFHSESPEAYLAHTPELRVVAASRPETAGALLLAAVRSDAPYVYLEPKRLYRRGRVPMSSVVGEVDPGRAVVLRPGTDLSLITYGPSVPLALEAADVLESEGVAAEVLDLVSLAPLDVEALLSSVRRTGRAVALTESVRRCSVASEVAATVASEGFSDLRAPVGLVTAPDLPPVAAAHEGSYFPSVEAVVAAAREVMR